MEREDELLTKIEADMKLLEGEGSGEGKVENENEASDNDASDNDASDNDASDNDASDNDASDNDIRLNRAKKAAERRMAKKIARLSKRRPTNKRNEIDEIMSKPLEQITDIIDQGQHNIEFQDSQEYKRALYELDIRKRQEKLQLAKSKSTITDEMLDKAGYSKLPEGMAPPEPISTTDLSGNLNRVVVSIPRDLLHGNMFGDGKCFIMADDGTNLLEDESVRKQQRQELLELHEEKKEGDELLEAKEESDEGTVPADQIVAKEENYQPNKAADFLMKLDIAQELGITRSDIAITKENQNEIKKFITGGSHDLETIKPFSIPKGIIGHGVIDGKKCLIAVDEPHVKYGQPGGLLALYQNDSFSKAPTQMPKYTPNIEKYTSTCCHGAYDLDEYEEPEEPEEPDEPISISINLFDKEEQEHVDKEEEQEHVGGLMRLVENGTHDIYKQEHVELFDHIKALTQQIDQLTSVVSDLNKRIEILETTQCPM